MVMAQAERAGGGQNDMEKELTCSVSRKVPPWIVEEWCCGVRRRGATAPDGV
jgi:hypothetical protein